MPFRLIPILLIDNRRLVKTINFSNPEYVGDPINAIKIFNEKCVDEICVIDIGAGKAKREPDLDYLEKIASECFIPLTYGGGIKTVTQASRIFNIGVEKVSIQKKFLRDPEVIIDFVQEFGSQSLVCSIDIRNRRFAPGYCITNSGKFNRYDLSSTLQKLQDLGVGEFLITAIHKEGSLAGPDPKLVKELVSINLNIPIIYNGGISSFEDILSLKQFGIHSVGAGAYFVYKGNNRAVLISYPNEKQVLVLNNPISK